MRKHVLVLKTTAAILACGAFAASAQVPSAQTPGTQQGPNTQPNSRRSDAGANCNAVPKPHVKRVKLGCVKNPHRLSQNSHADNLVP